MWAGRVQKLVYEDGTPKGALQILKERGINASHLKLEQMKVILQQHEDFHNEKSAVEHFLEGRGHIYKFIPKYHCEINAIEHVWAMSKQFTRAYCDYDMPSLKANVPRALDSVSCENIQNFIRRCRNYMFGYLAGLKPGSDMEKRITKYLKALRSHRRVSAHE